LEKSKPKLSIYIPTFNRADTLVELLNEIVKIKNKYPSLSFEIVVADNGSSDITSSLVLEGVRVGVVDYYVGRRVNEGADVNILDCFKFTSGDFVWILCDDDLPRINSVMRIINIIENFGDSISMIYLNRSVELMSGQLTMDRVSSCQDGVESSVPKLLRVPGIDLLTASTLVLRRQLLRGRYVSSYGFGHSVAPLALALDAISLGPAYLFSEPQVRYREGDKSGWIALWPKIFKITIPNLFRVFLKENKIPETEISWDIFE